MEMEMEMDMDMELLAHWRQVRTAPMRHLSRHANALTERRVRVNRLADINHICAHFNGQGSLAAPAN